MHMSYKNLCKEFNSVMPFVEPVGTQRWYYVASGGMQSCEGRFSQLVRPVGDNLLAVMLPEEIDCKVANTFHFTGVLYHQLCYQVANQHGMLSGSEIIPPEWVCFKSTDIDGVVTDEEE
eukprot:c45340_g1_i1 orf=3-359(+)